MSQVNKNRTYPKKGTTSEPPGTFACGMKRMIWNPRRRSSFCNFPSTRGSRSYLLRQNLERQAVPRIAKPKKVHVPLLYMHSPKIITWRSLRGPGIYHIQYLRVTWTLWESNCRTCLSGGSNSHGKIRQLPVRPEPCQQQHPQTAPASSA